MAVALVTGAILGIYAGACFAYADRVRNRSWSEHRARKRRKPCRFHESHGFEFSAYCPQCTQKDCER